MGQYNFLVVSEKKLKQEFQENIRKMQEQQA